jgi:uncharacterized protein (TIGR02453 family)
MADIEATIIGARVLKPAFDGFPPEALRFFRSLKRNNRREWFQPRKHIYEEQVRKPMFELVEAVNAALAEFAPMYINEPAAAVYRLYRDTRFSPDKTPYKTHIGAIFPRRGLAKHACAGFYFAVSAEQVEIAGGVYMPSADELRAIRTHLAEHHEEFRKLVKDAALRKLMGELQGDQLARVPKGFCSEHPAADLVRYKQWLLYITREPELAATRKLYPEILKRLRAMTPLMEFLNAPLIPARRGRPNEAFLA